MEETLPENQIGLPNSVTNDILHKMNMNPQQEASQYLTEKPPLNPVNSSLTPLEDPSKECNMHLLANAVDHVMYHPPSSATNANVESVVNIASGSDQQHGTTTTISRSSSTPFQSPAVLTPYKDNSLPTTSNTMNIAVGLISAHNYPSSVHPPSSSMPSSNYLPSGSSNTTPASVSSMHTISSSMPYAVMPSSIPLSSHIVHSASSLSYVSGSIRDSPTSSQHIVDTAASSVFSPSAGTIHRPTNSMPGISTMLQPSSSGLIKSSSSLTQKPVSVWPSGSSDPSVGAVSPAVSNIPLPTSGPLYTPLSSLQSNVMMSSSASQFQIASSSVTFEHKPNTTSPSISSMLGVSSSFESQPHMMEDASQSSSYSVSTSKKANLCTSDSSNHNIASISTVPHLSNSNARENRPTSSAPIHNSLHSTTGSQGYMKPNIFSQPSSTMLSQGEAAASCSSSLPESGQISSNPNNYLLSQSDSPSGPSSSEFSVVQVASSSLGRPSSALNNTPLLNTGKSDFSPCITTAADLRDTVSGSTDSPLKFQSDNLLGSSKVVSDTASLTSHIANPPLEKAKITSASGEKVTSASSSEVNNTILQKVMSVSVEKVTSGSNDNVSSASSDKVTSASGNNLTNENNNAESDKGITTSGQSCVTSGEKYNSPKVNVSLEAECVTSGSENVSTGTCITSIASNVTPGKNISTPEKALLSTGNVTSSPEAIKWDQNIVTSGRKELSDSGNSTYSDHVTSGTNNITFEQQACVSSGTNSSNISTDSGNVTSGINNVSSGTELSGVTSDSSSLKTRLSNSTLETNKSMADCTNSLLESSDTVHMIDSDRSNVSSSLIKSDQDAPSPLISDHSPSYLTSAQNSLQGKDLVKEKNNHFSEEDASNSMKADSSSSSLKAKHVTENSVSKEENSCSSTIADLETNCLKIFTKIKNKKQGKKCESDVSASKANSIVSDSTSGTNQKDENEATGSNDADPALKKTKISKMPDEKNSLPGIGGSEVKCEVKCEMTSNSPLPMADSAEDQGKEAMNKRSPGKKSVKCADTSTSSTDMGPDEVSPNRGQKRKRSQSPVSSSLAEPRRSGRQSKSKFNVLDLVGIGINIDYSLEDEKTPNKEVTKSSAVAADSSLTGELIVDVGDDEIYSNNSFDSNRRFKEKIDMEKIVAPFEQGWKREVVIRSVYEEFTKMGRPKRVPADVYYYAPDRRKLRSMVQIVNYLREKESKLTSENFNFMRRSIYKPPFEVVRHAGSKGFGPKTRTPRNSPKGLPKPEVVIDRDDVHEHEDNGCNAAGEEEEEEEDNPCIEPELELALAATALTVQQVGPSRWTATSGEDKEKVIKSEPVVKMEIENLTNDGAGAQQILSLQTPGKRPLENSNSSDKKPKRTKSVARKSTSQLPKSLSLADVISNAEPFQPCSLSCPGLVGIPPTLHCDICMCLFHIACVNLKDNEVPKVYTCKNCMKDEHLVRSKLVVNATTTTTTTTVIPPAIAAAAAATTATSTTVANKSIPTSLPSVTSINSPTSNIVNTITDSLASESEKKAKKVSSKTSVIQSSSKEPSTSIISAATATHPPRKHSNGSRQVVVNTLSMLNGSPGTESSPIEIPAEDDSQTVSNVQQFTPDTLDNVTCTQNLSNSVRPSIIPPRVKANKNTISSSLTVKKSAGLPQSSPPVSTLLPKDSINIMTAPSNLNSSNSSTTTSTTTAAAAASTTTITTTSSSSSTNITTTTTITTTSTNATTSASTYSIDCTKDLTLKNSMSLAPESPMIVSPSKLLAAPSHMLPPVTTSSSIKMETLSSSSSPSLSSSSSPTSSTHAHSGSGVNSVVGLQVSNTLLGSESYPRSGQLLTLPSAVAKRLNPSLPLALRINNMQLLIPPSRCINTAEGLKVFLPPKTFSVPSGSTTTMNITFSSGSMSADNAKDLSLSMLSKDKSMSLDMCDQVVDLSKTAETSKPVLKVTERRNKMKNYLCPFKTLYSGYNTMIQIFSYLSAGDLVRCSLVCRTWRQLATQSSLWNAIHLENTRISDWARATQFFGRYLVEELSLRGMQYEDDWNRVWHQLTPVLEQLATLKRLYFDHVPALMLYTVCQKLPQLEDLGANMISDFTNEQQWTTPTKIDLAKFCSLKHLRKLQLRGTGGLASSFSSGISEMVTLKNLQHLSLTSMKGVGDHDLDYLGELKGLKVLEMGDCTNWTSETYFQLGKLVNLERLRLEHGGEIPDVGLSDALLNLKSLCQLELIAFVIADSLHLALTQLKNLRRFVVWPDTTQQSALINSNTFVTLIKLPNLKQLEWGVIRNKNSSIILNEPRSVTTASNNIIGSDKDLGDNMELIPFLTPDAQMLASQTPNSNGQMSATSSENFTEYIGMRQLSEKLKCLLTNTQVTVFRTLDDASCVSSW